MFASFRFAARRAAAAARPRRIRTPTPLPAGFVNSQTAITDEALLDIATDRWFGKTFPPKVIGRVRDDEVGQRYLIIGEKKDEVGLRHTGQNLWQKSYAGKVGKARRPPFRRRARDTRAGSSRTGATAEASWATSTRSSARRRASSWRWSRLRSATGSTRTRSRTS